MTFAVTLNLPSATTIRRAPRVQPANDAVHKVDPYTILLACWVDFMNTDDRDLGAGRMRLNGEVIDDLSVYEKQRAADLRVGEAVNAMVNSLERLHRWSICRSQRIATVWNFPNADYAAVLMEAREELEKKLRKNLATKIYFA